MKDHQKRIIENYIRSYNNFDVAGMLKDLDQDIIFENISNGAVNSRTVGREEFSKQAEAAMEYFTKRKQTVESWDFADSKVVIKIQYEATLAIDFPNGMKKGNTLTMQGTSEFEFDGDKIKLIRDNS